jgi:hypothetical protein
MRIGESDSLVAAEDAGLPSETALHHLGSQDTSQITREQRATRGKPTTDDPLHPPYLNPR